MIRSLLPDRVKLFIRQVLNEFENVFNGYRFKFAKSRNKKTTFDNKVSLSQDLRSNEYKLVNLQLAIKSIEEIEILRNEIFSFWQIVGKTSKSNGYVESRSIINNKVSNSIGGGLCQLSGLIYHIVLIANLEILERYNHSIDIYDDESRFTPLGSDATVAFGYKDLKFRNNRDSPVKFTFVIDENTLTVELHFKNELKIRNVYFEEVFRNAEEIRVETKINGRVIEKSSYKIPAAYNQV